MKDLEKQLLEDYPTWKDFEEKMKPRALLSSYDFVKNLWDVYETSPITLKFLTETYPLKQSAAGYEYLEKWLRFLNDFLNINKKLENQQITDLAYMLYGKYSHFHLSDLKLLFTYILESRYGTFYGSIDTQRISSSFFEYNRERNEIFVKIEEKEKEALKNEAYIKPATKPDFSRLPNLAKLLGKDKELNVGESIAEKRSL